MLFLPTTLEDACIIDIERQSDARGFFARTFCAREFESRKLLSTFVQCNISFNSRRGTVRGLHYQAPPHTEAKLVRCIRGSIYDAIVDLRPDSATCGHYLGFELSAETGRSLYIPPGFAHGFQTLEDDVEVFYQMTNFYAPESAAGVRYDDPRIGIEWPLPVSLISDKDSNWPCLAQWENPFHGLRNK